MDLDRGRLARLDRKQLAGLGQDENARSRLLTVRRRWRLSRNGSERGTPTFVDGKKSSRATNGESNSQPRLRRTQEGRPPKVGRNERCPCGSRLKYKYCHGLPGRQRDLLSDNGLLAWSARLRGRPEWWGGRPCWGSSAA